MHTADRWRSWMRDGSGGAPLMSESFRTLSSDVGISLEVSQHFSEIADAEREPVALAAWVDPWPDEDQFRPNLVVEVEPLTAATATIQQLSTRTIAGQLALGRYVIGCDYVPSEDPPGGGPARRLISIYPALGTTVVQWQRVAILGNRAVIVTMQAGAANYSAAVRTVDHALRTLRVTFADAPVQPDPELMPRFDPLLLQRGEQLEDLSEIAVAESAPEDGIEPLDQPVSGGSERPLVLELLEPGATDPVSLLVPQRRDGRPVALARLLRVAPAWVLGFSDGDRSGLIDRRTFEARLRDPSTPAPTGANDALRRVWRAPWRLVTIDGQAAQGILVAERAGAHGFRQQGDQVRLTPLASHEILRALLQFAGFGLS